MNEYNLIIEARNKNEQAINLLLSKYYNNIKYHWFFLCPIPDKMTFS